MSLLRTRTAPHIPDILDCLAQLSNSQVPTPPKIARAMLDLLPAEVWTDPDLRWIDPFTKSGVFLREVASRLLDGLAEAEPDLGRRREHIFREMLFGCAITQITGIIARRTLYYSREADGERSVVAFDRDHGNVPFVAAEHTFEEDRSCVVCGAPASLERGEGRENYAYAFIHGVYPTKEMETMKFDVIVGNPPYQVDSDGNTRTMPIYQHFVRRAIEMDPKYLLMITPSRWFAAGLGLSEFRSQMLADRRMRELVDFRVERDAFPGVNINGGVSYFLWDRDHDGPCSVTHIAPGGTASGPEKRYLDEFDLLVRQNEAVAILRKVRALDEKTFECQVSARKPFDLDTDYRGLERKPRGADALVLHEARRLSWARRTDIVKNVAWADLWKVLVPAASDGNESFPLPIWDMATGPYVASPGHVCNGSYLVVAPGPTQTRAVRTAIYLRTRFVRFLVSLRKITQHNIADRFAFVPDLPMNQVWTDAKLYERYGLTPNDVAFIESQIKEMDPSPPERV
jgi:site-specific DNA-methyltransferase (adenine-specific)